VGAYLRRERLYSSLISEWRKYRDAGVLDGKKPGDKFGKLTTEQAEIARLKRELERANKRLATTETCAGNHGISTFALVATLRPTTYLTRSAPKDFAAVSSGQCRGASGSAHLRAAQLWVRVANELLTEATAHPREWPAPLPPHERPPRVSPGCVRHGSRPCAGSQQKYQRSGGCSRPPQGA